MTEKNDETGTWLERARDVRERIVVALAAVPAEELWRPVGQGAGGDSMVVADEVADRAVAEWAADLSAEGAGFELVSEESGVTAFGEPTVRILVDPIDGSLNAKRGIPVYSLSLAVTHIAKSPVEPFFGYVASLGTQDEVWAHAGRGLQATRRTARPEPSDTIELLALEGGSPHRVLPFLKTNPTICKRTRIIGSIALALAYLAQGAFDGLAGIQPSRGVDLSAGLLLAEEAGCSLVVDDATAGEPGDVGLDKRYWVTGAWSEQQARRLRSAVVQSGVH